MYFAKHGSRMWTPRPRHRLPASVHTCTPCRGLGSGFTSQPVPATASEACRKYGAGTALRRSPPSTTGHRLSSLEISVDQSRPDTGRGARGQARPRTQSQGPTLPAQQVHTHACVPVPRLPGPDGFGSSNRLGSGRHRQPAGSSKDTTGAFTDVQPRADGSITEMKLWRASCCGPGWGTRTPVCPLSSCRQRGPTVDWS